MHKYSHIYIYIGTYIRGFCLVSKILPNGFVWVLRRIVDCTYTGVLTRILVMYVNLRILEYRGVFFLDCACHSSRLK